MVLLGATGTVVAVVAVALVVPACTNTVSAVSGIILQGLSHPGLRGRVLGLNALVGAILLPIGMIGAGWLGVLLGVRTTLVILGALTVGCVVLIAWARPALGRIRLATMPPMPTASPVLELDPVGLETGARPLEPIEDANA
jgi:hypothetical protein